MTQVIVHELANSFKSTIGLLRESIRNLDDATWIKGKTYFQVPAKVAYHDVECLDYYFRAIGQKFIWGHRFGKPWWQLANEEQPSQEVLIEYLDELEHRIVEHFAGVQDEDLHEVFDPDVEHVRNKIGEYLYALRHTVHHLGSLASLAASLGVKPGEWDNWA